MPMAEKWNNRALFSLLWPLIVEQILAVTMGAADTMMVSSVGEHAVSAVNIVDNINNLLIIAFTAMCTGGAVVVSQYIGRRDYTNSSNAAKQLVYIVVLVSLVITFVAVALRRPVIRLIYGKIEQDVMNAAALYFFITGMSYPFLAIYNANAALFRAVGNSKVTMRIAITVNLLNIGGNALLIYGFHFGVAGAAISTLVSRIVAAVITTVMLVRSSGPISLSNLFRIRFSQQQTRSILNVGLPSGLEYSMFQIGRLMTQRIFTGFGTAAMAGNAIAGVINSFSFMPGTAFGMALLTIVGQCVGAKDYDEAGKQTGKIMKLTYITLFIISALVYIFMDPLISIFNLSPEAQIMAKSFLRVHCISMAIGWPISFALPNALRAAGDVRYVMLVATISMWTVRVSAAYLFTYVFGIGPLGVWLAKGADFMVRGGSFSLRWLRGKWKDKKVLAD
jgi:putative MATE family efflux protein